jgi:hypothetical protein
MFLDINNKYGRMNDIHLPSYYTRTHSKDVTLIHLLLIIRHCVSLITQIITSSSMHIQYYIATPTYIHSLSVAWLTTRCTDATRNSPNAKKPTPLSRRSRIERWAISLRSTISHSRRRQKSVERMRKKKWYVMYNGYGEEGRGGEGYVAMKQAYSNRM